MSWRMRRTMRLALALAGFWGAAVALSACGGAEAGRAPSAGSAETVGTFRAVLDGRERTWHAVAGTRDGEVESSAVWVPLSEGERMASLGGFDEPDVPVETFEFDLGQGRISLGDYEGSLLALTFTFEADDFERTVRGSEAPVLYFPEIPGGEIDYASVYMLTEGALDVVLIEMSEDGTGRFEGTFSGTLTSMGEGRSMKLTDGRFTVERALRREPAEP